MTSPPTARRVTARVTARVHDPIACLEERSTACHSFVSLRGHRYAPPRLPCKRLLQPPD